MHRLETTSPNSLIGLLEILEDIGKSTDIAKLDDSLDEERTMLMNLLDDAESLKLLMVSNGDASLTEIGKKFLDSNIEQRKRLLKALVKDVEPFHSLINFFKSLNTTEVPKEDVVRYLGEIFPPGEHDDTFRVVLNWGRYTKLFSYDSDVGLIVFQD
ncbi:MAG: AAA-associated domain-containing protein [Candidatus Thermoplasmatota archaeon]|nr:AAA-associated domain-containing protein [Candidatus Thermoplasmatota archaeon]MCL6002373.1 AAA-associated domain-containing protein [Candidatus Thermoplasmatota archaeon]